MTTDEAAVARGAAEIARSTEERALDGEVVTSRRGGDPAAIEDEIARRRDHLAATVDELSVRLRPTNLARSGARGVTARIRAAALTPQGELRTERLGAVVAALTVLAVLAVVLRRRRR